MADLFELHPPKPFINSAVEATLHAFGYPFSVVGGDDYRFRVKTGSGAWFRAQIIVYPESEVVRWWVFLTDSLYHKDRAGFVRELAEELTARLVFGAFVFSGATGSVAFRDATHVTEGRAELEIEAMLNHSALALRLFEIGFGCWKLPKATAATATRLAMLLECCDEGGMTKEQQRELLSIEKGTKAAT